MSQPKNGIGTSNKKAEKLFNEALNKYQQRDAEGALKLLVEVLEKDPNFVDAYMLTGELYEKTRQPEKAIEVYAKVLSISKEVQQAYYGLAHLALESGNYLIAKENIDHFLAFKLSPRTTEEAKRIQQIAEFGIQQLKQPQTFEPVNMGPGINSSNREYFASITVDGKTLIYDRQESRGDEEFMIAKQNPDGSWGVAKNAGTPLNTPEKESYPSFTADGYFVFFCKFNPPPNNDNDIWFAAFNGEAWNKPVNVGYPINSKSWESQPCISADGRTLYFLSGMPGGLGGIDIWKSTLAGGHWGKPVNLGPKVNSSGNEEAPFIHPDGQTLYFSSTGHLGMGKSDIFLSRLQKDGSWSEAENMGYPINTHEDEMALCVAANGVDAILTSGYIKGGFGDWDLWTFKMPESKRPVQTTYVAGLVYDVDTKQPLEADVELINLETGKTEYQTMCNSKGMMMACLRTGVNYAFNVGNDGYLFFSENYSFGQTLPNKPIKQEIPLKKIVPGGTVILKNVFFETAKFDLKRESNIELDKLVTLLKQNPKLKIELSGHTDNVGQKQENQLLSQNRAKAVYDYLVKQGIGAARLSHKGYGDTKPVADNNTDEGRHKNRRTEFKVV